MYVNVFNCRLKVVKNIISISNNFQIIIKFSVGRQFKKKKKYLCSYNLVHVDIVYKVVRTLNRGETTLESIL